MQFESRSNAKHTTHHRIDPGLRFVRVERIQLNQSRMQDALKNFFTQPLVIGICIGLIVAIALWVRSIIRIRTFQTEARARQNALQAEITKLQQHLHTQMEIQAKGNESIRQEVADLKTVNANLSQTSRKPSEHSSKSPDAARSAHCTSTKRPFVS